MPKQAEEQEADLINKRIIAGVENQDLPNISLNGFVCSLTIGDIVIVAERNKQPVAVINCSFTVAKTLAEKLNEIIGRLEARTGKSIMTTDYIVQAAKDEQAGKVASGSKKKQR